MSNNWNFPPVPPELKPLSPFFQRAQELKTKDAVMAYWCTYYAAKKAISSNALTKEARSFLYQVMTILEQMKASLAENDAVSDDDAGAAYIENFAMRVFTMADNEDRNAEATRSTAKKFLASANFFELLNVFDKLVDTDISEKIRYAKWKAADIAKAFREGRKPTPGDAQTPDTTHSTLEPPPVLESMSGWTPSPETSVAPSPARGKDGATPLPPHITDLPPLPATPPQPTQQYQQDEYATPSGAWSTAATPGTEDVHHDGLGEEAESPSVRSKKRLDAEEGDDGEEDGWSTIANASRQGSWTAPAQGSNKEEGGDGLGLQHTDEPAELPPSPPYALPAVKKVHFSPSVVGGLSSATSSIAATSPPGSPTFIPSLPTLPEERAPPVVQRLPPPPPMSPPRPPAILPHIPTATQQPPHSPSTAPSYPLFTPQFPSSASHPNRGIPPPPPSPPPAELTPMQITKVQKHCKFAISALDYEDVYTARKELLAALAMLGE